MIFKILALLVLAIFYGIYIGKMLAQKKKGIQTDQIAKGSKRGKLFVIELLMKIATYSVVAVEVVSIIMDFNYSPEWLRIAGVILAFLGVLFFGVSVYTMRDSWRAGIPEKDRTEFVTTGVYKISRNPAFLGFDLVYVGLLLMFLNPVLAVFSVFAGVMLHLQILEEEKFLAGVFGKEYEGYKRSVARYIGRK